MSASLRPRTRGVGRCWQPASASAQAWLASAARAQDDPARERPREGDLLVITGDTPPNPLTANDIPLGAGQVMAWPMDPAANVVRDGSRLNKVLLVRLDPGTMEAPTQERSADGVVGYSAICPHTGCEVANWSTELTNARVSLPQ